MNKMLRFAVGSAMGTIALCSFAPAEAHSSNVGPSLSVPTCSASPSVQFSARYAAAGTPCAAGAVKRIAGVDVRTAGQIAAKAASGTSRERPVRSLPRARDGGPLFQDIGAAY